MLKIIHRDIKPGNILYMGDYTYKMADFGTSRLFISKNDCVTLIGTPNYFAPEIKEIFNKASKE